MSLPDDLKKVVEDIKKMIVVKPEVQAQIDDTKKSKESGTINKR